MTIQAIHTANVMLRPIAFEILGAIFGALSLGVSYAHSRDGFRILTGCEVFDLVSDIHVPMNTAYWPA